MNTVRWVLRIGLPILVIAAGAMVMRKLVASKSQAKKVAPQARGALVSVRTVEAGTRAVRVDAHGTVTPARTLELKTQVGGKVVEIAEALVPGGRIPESTLLVRIERRDYDLAIHEAAARVASAEQNLELERGRGSVAAREWKLLGEGGTDASARRRALRGPQKDNAVAAVKAATAAVSKARLVAGRTRLTAPFNALVMEEAVEEGQVVQPGLRLARLVGTDAFWVQVSVPVADLSWIEVPGATATVIHRAGARVVKRRGSVVRMLGDLDPRGSMARLVVEVVDPLGLADGGEALLLGAFVEVEIDGRSADGVYEIPRQALREGGRVWRVGPEQTLQAAPVTILRRLRDTVLIDGGLADGDQIVTSRLASPVPGMKLRVKVPEATPRAEVERER